MSKNRQPRRGEDRDQEDRIERQTRRAGFRGRRSARAGWLFGAALLLAACTPPVRQYELRDRPISCDDANRFSYKTLESMGFTITVFEPATYGQKGTLRGERRREGESSAREVSVEIDCQPGGVSIDARDVRKWIDQIDFKRGFFMSFTNVAAMTAADEEMEARIAAGTAPESLQRHDLQVEIEPVPGHASKLHFGLDLAAAGVLPVRLHLVNHTDRTYELEPGRLRLTDAARNRTEAMSVNDAAERVASARAAESGEPITTLSRAEISEKLGAELFSATSLPPGGHATGYLYFPLAEYRGARFVLTDAKSGEAEGVAVDF